METLFREEDEKQEQDDRAKAGGLSALAARFGIGAAAGGGATPLAAGNAALYGLMASKGGIVALILTGTTVAAGVGIVGSQLGLFSSNAGPEPEPGVVFEQIAAQSRPRGLAQGGHGVRNGISESLEYLVRANRPKRMAFAADPTIARRPMTDAMASRSASGASELAVAAAASQFDARRTERPASANFARPALKPQAGLSGGIGKSFQPVFRAALPEAAAPAQPAPAAPSTAAGGAGSGGADGYGAGRLGLKGNGNKAQDQLTMTNRVERTNLRSSEVSSAGSGATYDGAAPKAMAPLRLNAFVWRGPGASPAGAGTAPALDESGLSSKDITPPPPAKAAGPTENKTPWQWAVNVAMAAMAMATLAFMAMTYFKSIGNLLFAQMAGAVATAAGAMASSMGLLLMSTYKQQLQGAEWAAIGAMTAAMAARNLASLNASADYKHATQDQGQQSSQQTNQFLQAPAMPGSLGGGSSQSQPSQPASSQSWNQNQGSSGGPSSLDSSPGAAEPQPGSGPAPDPTQVDPNDPNTVITSQGG